MTTRLLIALAIVFAAASFTVPSDADAQTITRTNTRGQKVNLTLPQTCGQCLANRRKLGYNIKRDGPGRCARFFPGCG